MGAVLIQTTTLAERRSNLAGCFITTEYNICQLAYSKIILHQETLLARQYLFQCKLVLNTNKMYLNEAHHRLNVSFI